MCSATMEHGLLDIMKHSSSIATGVHGVAKKNKK